MTGDLLLVAPLPLVGAVLFGEVKNIDLNYRSKDTSGVILVLALVALLVIFLGVYPTPIFEIIAR